jgi:hypothetical protein
MHLETIFLNGAILIINLKDLIVENEQLFSSVHTEMSTLHVLYNKANRSCVEPNYFLGLHTVCSTYTYILKNQHFLKHSLCRWKFTSCSLQYNTIDWLYFNIVVSSLYIQLYCILVNYWRIYYSYSILHYFSSLIIFKYNENKHFTVNQCYGHGSLQLFLTYSIGILKLNLS